MTTVPLAAAFVSDPQDPIRLTAVVHFPDQREPQDLTSRYAAGYLTAEELQDEANALSRTEPGAVIHVGVTEDYAAMMMTLTDRLTSRQLRARRDRVEAAVARLTPEERAWAKQYWKRHVDAAIACLRDAADAANAAAGKDAADTPAR